MKKDVFEGIECQDAFGSWEFEGRDEQLYCRKSAVKQVGKTTRQPDR